MFLLRLLTVILPGLCTLSVASTSAAQTKKLFYMRQSDSKMVEFDLAAMSDTNSFSIPKSAFDTQRAPKVHVNSAGQMLLLPMESQRELIFWDGSKARTIESDFNKVINVSYFSNGPLLAADGKSYFFEKNDGKLYYGPKQTVSPEYKLPESVHAVFQVFQKSLLPEATKEAAKLIISRPFELCRCSTGACEESCPVGQIVNPLGVVDDLLIVKTFVMGQLMSRDEEFFKYKFNGKSWSDSKVVGKFQHVLATSSDGEELIVTKGGGGCCGWANQSNQIVTLLNARGESEIYNQYKEHGNEDYDIEIANVSNMFGPSGRHIAMRFNEGHNNCENQDECAAALKIDPKLSIRRANDKKIDLTVLTKLIKDIPRYPVTRIIASSSPNVALIEFEQTVPIGWLSEDMLLVVSKEKAKIFHLGTKKLEDLPINVFKDRVFLRNSN